MVRLEDNTIWRIVGKCLLAKQKHTNGLGGLSADLSDFDNASALYLDIVALYDLTR